MSYLKISLLYYYNNIKQIPSYNIKNNKIKKKEKIIKKIQLLKNNNSIKINILGDKYCTGHSVFSTRLTAALRKPCNFAHPCSNLAAALQG